MSNCIDCKKELGRNHKTPRCFWCQRKYNFYHGNTLNRDGKEYSRRYNKDGSYQYVVK